MDIVIDRPAAYDATPRPRLSLRSAIDACTGVRLLADDAQPRLENRPLMTASAGGWRHEAGSTMRAFRATEQDTKAGRTVDLDRAYVTTFKQHSIRSGPPPSRP